MSNKKCAIVLSIAVASGFAVACSGSTSAEDMQEGEGAGGASNDSHSNGVSSNASNASNASDASNASNPESNDPSPNEGDNGDEDASVLLPTADGSAPKDSGSTPGVVNPPIKTGKRCHLHLHWAGGSGKADSINLEGVTEVWPQSPGGAFWLYDGPHNFAYDPQTGDADYQAYVKFLKGALDKSQCGPTIVIGYSNGGGLAAKLFCSGEDFGGRAWGYIVSDPVMDDGVRGCKPSPNIRKTLFTHSDELTNQAAAANHSCSVTSWYCQDNRTMPLAEYEMQIGQKSVRDRAEHAGAVDPQYAAWNVPVSWWKNDF